jgi:ABC-2 type transport system ATP-binding protein
MLNNLKNTRHLTMLLTTHYMEEADKLCDRIAIVDHGKLVALGTPTELKNSVAGANVVEVHFDREAEEWKGRLQGLEGVTSVQPESSGFYRVITKSGSKTTMQIVELAQSLGETLTSLSVQNTTLDDVFVHYTGRQLRDEQVKPQLASWAMLQRPGDQR